MEQFNGKEPIVLTGDINEAYILMFLAVICQILQREGGRFC